MPLFAAGLLARPFRKDLPAPPIGSFRDVVIREYCGVRRVECGLFDYRSAPPPHRERCPQQHSAKL